MIKFEECSFKDMVETAMLPDKTSEEMRALAPNFMKFLKQRAGNWYMDGCNVVIYNKTWEYTISERKRCKYSICKENRRDGNRNIYYIKEV